MAFRRLPTSLRTVDRYHRALDTMGKLAAQQAAPPLDPAKSADHPRLTQPAEPDHSYARVVRDETAPAAPPRPPTLRSRPRRPRPPAYPDAVTTPGPNTRIVRVDEPPLTSTPPPGSSPSQLEPGRIERSALGADAPDVTTSASKTAPPALRSRHAGSGEAEKGPVLNGQVEHGPVDHGPLASGPVDNGTIRPSDAAGSKTLYFDAVDDLPHALHPPGVHLELGRGGPHRIGLGVTGPVPLGPIRLGPIRLGPIRLRPIRLGPVPLGAVSIPLSGANVPAVDPGCPALLGGGRGCGRPAHCRRGRRFPSGRRGRVAWPESGPKPPGHANTTGDAGRLRPDRLDSRSDDPGADC